MTLRANFQKSYLWRYLAMAGIGFFMAAWFAYDGLIGYPQEQQRSAAYEQMAEEIADKKELYQKWRETARNNGWNVETPKEKAADFPNKIVGQYVYGSLCLFLAIPALALYFRSRNRWIEYADNGLTTSWGQSVNFADVTLLNKKRWENKGIAKAYYMQQGTKRCFVFDDFKYDREPIGQMLKQLETQLQPEQIVGQPKDATVANQDDQP